MGRVMVARAMWWVGVLAAVGCGWGSPAVGGEVVELIHTSEVRGTVGICG